jgi:hypothetical protein
MSYGISRGNWGMKKAQSARWVRTGKMVAWGPGIEDWEVCDMIYSSRNFYLNEI